MHSVYNCDERETFIYSCINKLEGMKPEDIAPVINNFVERYVLYVLLRLLAVVCFNKSTVVQNPWCVLSVYSVCMSSLKP